MTTKKETELIYQKIAEIHNELGAVKKKKVNGGLQYAFRGIEDMYNKIKPLLSSHRVFVVTEICSTKEWVHEIKQRIVFRTTVVVKHHFTTIDGSKITMETIGEGMDYSDKATSKAMSMAMKYAFIELFSIPTTDISDSDKENITPSKEVEIKKITDIDF